MVLFYLLILYRRRFDFSGILRISPDVGIVPGKTFYLHDFTVPFMFRSISCEFVDFESL